MTKNQPRVVPILKPEHCTPEYMKSVGVPVEGKECYSWEEFVFGDDTNNERLLRREAGFFDARTPEENADAFNKYVKLLDPDAKPTGEPYPFPEKATTR